MFMTQSVPNIDTFLVDQFSKNGMKNIYGPNPEIVKLRTVKSGNKFIDS